MQGTQCPGVVQASVEMGSVPLLPSTSLNCQTEQRQLQTLVYFSEEEIMNSLCSKWEIRKSLKKKIKPTSYPAMVNISIHFLPTCMHVFSRCHKAEITQGIIFVYIIFNLIVSPDCIQVEKTVIVIKITFMKMTFCGEEFYRSFFEPN